MPCQGPYARSTILALLLLALATGVQLAPPRIQSVPSAEASAAEANNIAPPLKSGDVTTTTMKSIALAKAAATPNDLLDQHKLVFITTCLATNVNKADVLLCNLYRNLTTVLATDKQDPVTAETVQEMLADQDTSGGTEKFCENLSPVLQALRKKATSGNKQLQFETKPLERELVCAKLCLPMDDVEFRVTLKPICRVLLWGFRRLLKPEPAVGSEPAAEGGQVVGKVVIPPLIDQGLKLEKLVESKADAAAKPAKPVQQTSVAVTNAHATPSTNSAPAADKPIESVAKAPTEEVAPGKGEPQKTPDEDEETGAFGDMEAEAKNQQNLDELNGGEGGPKEPLDTGDDEPMYPGDDSDEDPSMDTNAPTAAGAVAAGSAPKEMAVREQQPEPLPRLEKEDRLGLGDVQSQELPVDPFFEESDSNFFFYFLLVMFACIVCYVAYHNKSKLLALALEGRRSSTGRGGFSKGRKHTAAYRKLDSNLEEAIMSNSAASSRSQQQIIY